MAAPRTALLTGGTGFVGANLARRLLRDGHRVHLLVRPGHQPWRIEAIRGDVALHLADLGDRAAVETAVKRVRPDWVFHLAAHGAYSHQRSLRAIVATNVVGTANLLEACLEAGFEAFVNTGSSSEYGYREGAAKETDPLEPNSDYAVTKASATLLCRFTARDHGLRVPTLRLYSVFGPFEEPTRFLPTLLVHGLARRLPPLVDPDTARDFVHVDDVCEAYVRAAAVATGDPGAVYNVGTGVQTTIAAVVALAREEMGIEEEPVWRSMPGRRWDTRSWVADPSRIAEALGWRPAVPFPEGFRSTRRWLESSPAILARFRAAVLPPG